MTSDAQILARPAATGDSPDPRRWLTLIILLLAAFMNLLDVSIVNIAIPSIQRDLHASYADVQWALAGYTLAYALVLITGGRLGDTFGRKRLFLIGVSGFTIMSALCGAAQSPGQLIAFRVIQGAMGAIMVPQVLAVIQVIFPPAERIKALAGFGITAGLGTVSGPLIGGLLIQHNLFGLTWRPIFLINVPVGVVLVSVALLLLLYPLVQGRQLGWPGWTFVSMAASAPVLALFIWWEQVKTRRDGSPLVPLRLFSHREFSVGMAIAMTFFLGIASFGLVLTLFLQLGLGFTPLHAGLTFLPFSLGILASSGAAARLAPRFGRGVTMAGALIMAAGMAGLIAAVHHYGAAVTTWELVPGLVAAGLGLGAVIAPLADIVLDRVPHQDAGSASGVFNTGLKLGNSIGIAVIGVIFFGMLGSQSGPAASTVAPALRSQVVAAGVPAQAAGHLEAQFRTCLHDRLVASDPTVTPAACQPPAGVVLSPGVRKIVAGAGISAVRHDFAASLVRTLWFQVGVFVLAFLMMLAWPRGAGRRVTAPGGEVAGAPESPGPGAQESAQVVAGQGAVHAATAAARPGGSVAAGPGGSVAASNGRVT